MIDRDMQVRRAMDAMRALHTNARYTANKNNIGDLILDLMHYAAIEGKDFEKELAFARTAFTEDTSERAKQ